MIQLTAEIKIFSENNGKITGLSSNISGNNVSCDISELIGKDDSVGGNPFILGVSKFGDGSVYTADKVDYFIGREISGDLGYFNTPYEITLTGNNIKSITFVFDTVNGGYPKSMSVDGTYFTDDDATFTISDTTIVDFWADNVTEHKIIIYSWSKPNRPLILQGVYATPTNLKIDRRSLISVDSNIIDRSDISLPSWGVISNRGNLFFNDINGDVLDYAEQGLLQEGQEVNIYLKDTLSGLETTVGSFVTISWDYDNNSKVVTVELSDGLEDLQQIQNILMYPKYDEDTMLYVLQKVLESKYILQNDIVFLGNTLYFLRNTTLSLYEFPRESVWAQLQKVCDVCGLYVCVNPKNKNQLIISN